MTTVVAEPFATMDPSPRVEITVSAVDPDAVTATVVQLSAGGQYTVRGGESLSVVGGAFITDYEVPLGVPVQYRVELFDVSGVALGYTDPQTIDPIEIESSHVVIQDTLDPAKAVLVPGRGPFGDELVRSRSMQLHRAGTETIALMGEPGLLENVPLPVYTETAADQEALDEILLTGDILIRTMAPVPLPRLLYVVIEAPRRVPFDAQYGGTINDYDLAGQQISRNLLNIIVPLVTYQRLEDYYATYADLEAAHPTYLSIVSDPPPEV